MYPICLDNLVSVKDLCDNKYTYCSSGYDIFDAPEIHSSMIGNLGNSDIASGIETIKKLRCNVLKHFETDFVSMLSQKKYTLQLQSNTYSSGTFNNTTNSTFNGERGLVIHYANYNVNSLRKIRIKKINIYSQTSGVVNLKIQ